MKIHDMAQGSLDWYNLRIGIPTSSAFERIVAPSTGKISRPKTGKGLADKVRKFAFFLVSEKLLNRSLESLDGLEWIDRGKELEPMAVKMFEFENEVETKPVGFITTDDMQIGCSPDRLMIGINGAVELKCPAPQTHVGYMEEGFGDDYIPQVQGQMLVGEFDFVKLYSFHPELPPHTTLTNRDEEYIGNLRDALTEFNDYRLEMLHRIKSKGFFAERQKILLPQDELMEAIEGKK